MIESDGIGIYWPDECKLPWINIGQQKPGELWHNVKDMARQLAEGILKETTTWILTEHGWEYEDRIEFDLAMAAIVGFLICNHFPLEERKEEAVKLSFSRAVRIPVNSALFEGREKELFPALLGLNTVHLVRKPYQHWSDDSVRQFKYTRGGKVSMLQSGGNGLWRWSVEDAPDKAARAEMRQQGWKEPFLGRCVVCSFNDDVVSVLPFCREYLEDISKYIEWWNDWYSPVATSHWAQSKSCRAVWEQLYGPAELSKYTYKRGSISTNFQGEIKYTLPVSLPPYEWYKLTAKEIKHNCRMACKTFIDANLELCEKDPLSKDLFMMGVVGFLVYNHHVGSIPGKKTFNSVVQIPLVELGARYGFDLSACVPISEDEQVWIGKGEGAQLLDMIAYRKQEKQAIFQWGEKGERWDAFWEIDWNDLWEYDNPAYVTIRWNIPFCQLLPFAVDLLGDISEYVRFCEDCAREDGYLNVCCDMDDKIYKCVEGAFHHEAR